MSGGPAASKPLLQSAAERDALSEQNSSVCPDLPLLGLQGRQLSRRSLQLVGQTRRLCHDFGAAMPLSVSLGGILRCLRLHGNQRCR